VEDAMIYSFLSHIWAAMKLVFLVALCLCERTPTKCIPLAKYLVALAC